MTVDEIPGVRRIRVGWHGHFALVSESKFHLVQFKTWTLQKTRTPGLVYAVCPGVGSMHKLVYGEVAAGMVVDHRDGNGLNNTDENLIERTKGGNAQNKRLDRRNRSGVTNVRFNEKTGKWDAFFRHDGDNFGCIGSFKTRERAAVEVERYEIDHRGESRRPRETDKIARKSSHELLTKARKFRKATG